MRAQLRRTAAMAGTIVVVALGSCATPYAVADPTDVPAPPAPPTTVPMAPGAPPVPAPAPDQARPAGSEPAPPPDGNTFALGDLGSSDTIWFDTRSDITSSTISFVASKGLIPSRLNTRVEVPVELRSGYLTVTQNGRTLSRMPLPTKDQPPAMSIPLDGVKTYGDWATITLTITAVPVVDYWCWNPESPIRLTDSSVTFNGTEAPPATVAAFLPPTPRRISIAVPRNLSGAESAAAIQLAAALTRKYGWQGPDIAVIPLPDGTTQLPEPARSERQIVIKEGPDPGLSLQPSPGVPSLLITGQGDELTNQTRLLTDPSLQFALSTKAVAGPLTTELRPASDSVTLAKLKQRVGNSESLRPEVTIKIDQTAFAQPLDNIRVHVIGSYTPLPNAFNGEVIAMVDDQVIDQWPVSTEGTIDRWVEIPNRLVQRSTALKIRVHTTGDPGHCNDFLNPMLRIDPDTEITVHRASPPAPPGLRSLPQALMPRVQIGMGSDTYNDTVRAARIIVGLQRSSSLPLLTTVVPLQEAIASRDPAILIAGDGWNDQSLTLPISADLGKITIDAMNPAGDATTLTLDPAIKYGSLQTVFDGQRTVLIATSTGDSAQLDELLRWLSLDRSRWSDLDGRAVIAVPGNEPVTVPNRPSDLPDAKPESSGQGVGDYVWWAAGGLAAIALAGAVYIFLRTKNETTSVKTTSAATDESAGTHEG
jgi:hypothetical protein